MKLYVPTAPTVVGGAAISPVVVFRVKDGGSDPAITLQVKGTVPPAACRVFE
jgi:hypothetical protein